jgi:F-type H+-transporting ATPase subunit b
VTRLVGLVLAALCCCGTAPGLASAQEHDGKANAAAPHAEPAESGNADTHGTEGGEGTHDDHAAGGHADPYDLAHNNASASLHSPADARFDLAIWTFVVFLALLAILTKFAWGPIAAALERREETIARQIEEARLASERAAVQLKEYEARLAAATDEARQIVGGARKDAEIAKERILAEAQQAAQRERERAVADISIAKNQALQEIAQRSVHTAVALAGNILRREVKQDEHDLLIGQAIDEFTKLN